MPTAEVSLSEREARATNQGAQSHADSRLHRTVIGAELEDGEHAQTLTGRAKGRARGSAGTKGCSDILSMRLEDGAIGPGVDEPRCL